MVWFQVLNNGAGGRRPVHIKLGIGRHSAHATKKSIYRFAKIESSAVLWGDQARLAEHWLSSRY